MNSYCDDYIFLFATFDVGLGRVFSSIHGIQSDKELFNVLPANKREKYYAFYKELCKKHTKLQINEDVYQYCYDLIDSETADLCKYIIN